MTTSPSEPQVETKAGPRRTAVLGALATILILGILIRAQGVTRGLPLLTHPDEPIIMNRAKAILWDRDPNPHYFGYPSMYV